jgi:UPF0755 protein
LKNFTLTVLASLSLVAALLALFLSYEFKKPSALFSPTIIVIEKGTGVLEMGQVLTEKNIISNPYIFAFFAKATNQASRLQAGEYEFAPASPMALVLHKIATGDVVKRKLTFIEGMTSFEIVEKLNQANFLVDLIQDVPQEGSLLPETYIFPSSTSRKAVIAHMQKMMEQVLTREWQKRQPNLPLASPYEALILASIVEKETSVPSERKRVAGVFINRLRLGMKLQSDPTVIYGITLGAHQNDGQGPLGRRLLTKDLQTPSPYNSYMNTGLPPTPIANPGKDSVIAALNPEAHDYLFFVADGTGAHIFSKTYEDHNRAVQNWRKIRKNRESQ